MNGLNENLSKSIDANENVKCVLMFGLNEQYTDPPECRLENALQGLKPTAVALGGGLLRPTFTKNDPPSRMGKYEWHCITFIQEDRTKADFNAYSVVIDFGLNIMNELDTELMKLKESCVT